jgi:hypothetical protein
LPVGLVTPAQFVPQFGPTHFTPPFYVLSRLDYQAIPVHVAIQQYLPAPGYAERLQTYFHPSKRHRVRPSPQNIIGIENNGSNGYNVNINNNNLFGGEDDNNDNQPGDGPHGTLTLDRRVFTRGKFKTGKTVAFTHQVPVIPTYRQSERYVPTPKVRPPLLP